MAWVGNLAKGAFMAVASAFALLFVVILIVIAIPGIAFLTSEFGPLSERGPTASMIVLAIPTISVAAILVFLSLVLWRAVKTWRQQRQAGEEPRPFWTDLRTIRTVVIGIAVILGAQWLMLQMVRWLLPAGAFPPS